MLLNNLTKQKRAWGTNLNLIITPVFFCVMLYVLQTLINNALDTAANKVGAQCVCVRVWVCVSERGAVGHTRNGRQRAPRRSPVQHPPLRPRLTPPPPAPLALQCGCYCLTCCQTNDGVKTCRDSTPENPCQAWEDCDNYDTSRCGFQYSDAGQASFCTLPTPSSWPALLQAREAWGGLARGGRGGVRGGSCAAWGCWRGAPPAPP